METKDQAAPSTRPKAAASSSVTNLKRYKEIARLLWKYGRSDLVSQMDLDEPLDSETTSVAIEAGPEQLADDLEAMGPTYVKVGQVLSGRRDLLPDAYVKALARLQDNVKPFSYDEVNEIVASELGVRISKAFSRFDAQPIASASLGQVHAAALRDGRNVVVKVQRPNIRKQIADDFDVLEHLAQLVDAHTEVGRRYRFKVIVDELRTSIHHELDYTREARNLIALGENLKKFELIQVPQPVSDYSTSSVLTMDQVQGRKLTSVGPLSRLEIDGAPLAEQLFRAYLQQVLVDGLFHADPHPGNVFLTDDGRIALLDLGMVGHTTPSMQENLLKLLLAIADGKGDDAAEILIRISEKSEEPDLAEFRRRVGRIIVASGHVGVQRLNVGMTLFQGSKIAGECGLYVPGELTLLGKTLLQLEDIGKCLDPTFDPNAYIRRNVHELVSQRMKKQSTASSVVGSLLDIKEFAAGLPGRLNKLMDTVGNNEIEIKVRTVDVNKVIEGLQTIANRITTGLVLAALIMGASILMQIQTSFRIFGYPGLAILLFLAAATGGIWLIASAFVQDQRNRKK